MAEYPYLQDNTAFSDYSEQALRARALEVERLDVPDERLILESAIAHARELIGKPGHLHATKWLEDAIQKNEEALKVLEVK